MTLIIKADYTLLIEDICKNLELKTRVPLMYSCFYCWVGPQYSVQHGKIVQIPELIVT